MITSQINAIQFHCEACGFSILGNDDDTLIVDNELVSGDSSAQNAQLIRNAPYDAAGVRKKMDCKKCGLDYMTALILDQGSRVVYVCECGNQIEGGQ